MTNHAGVPQLLRAVREWINDERACGPDAASRHAARIATNLLDIIARELEIGPRLRASERLRLAALLGRDADLEALNEALCAKIAAGAIDVDDPHLLNHLRLTALGKLAIDNPGYWSYRRAAARVGFNDSSLPVSAEI
jgi:hypothetical protein